MSLAQRLRYQNIPQMLADLNSRDIADWLAYFCIENEHFETRRNEAELEARATAGLNELKRGR